MAETKHTPGPWRIHCDLYAEAGDNLIVAKAKQFTDYKVSMANARLIAAAPELLEALKETRWLATRQMRTEPFSDQELDRAAQALEMAKLAIEKAKGRAP